MGPLEAAVGGADAAPIVLAACRRQSAPQVELVQTLVFLLLVLDVLPYRRFVPTHGRDEVPSGPEMLSHEVALPLPVRPGQVDCALALDKADHLRNRVFRRD